MGHLVGFIRKYRIRVIAVGFSKDGGGGSATNYVYFFILSRFVG